MSEPKKVFQNTKNHQKTGNLSSLTKQIEYWQKLTTLIQHLLPQPENWQVACYQQGVLTLTGENQAMISQLNYLQTQYLTQLAQLDDFRDLQKIQVRLRAPTNPNLQQNTHTNTQETHLSPEVQDMLSSAASLVNDPKLSEALLRLASRKK